MTRDFRYCPDCGSGRIGRQVPPDDDRERQVCDACGGVHYQNPRNVAGCIAEHQGRLLLCRRAIAPRRGFWTVPAGFMENDETLEQAAARETLEEARATVAELALYCVFSLPHISQVYFLYRATVPDGEAAPGLESLEVDWCAEGDLPWDALAFPVIHEGLRLYCADRRRGRFPVRTGEIRRRADGGHDTRQEAVG